MNDIKIIAAFRATAIVALAILSGSLIGFSVIFHPLWLATIFFGGVIVYLLIGFWRVCYYKILEELERKTTDTCQLP